MAHEIRVYEDPNEDLEDDLLPEYDFSSMNEKFNPYAAQAARRQSVHSITLEDDSAEVFQTSEQVNKALRALLEAVPPHHIQGRAVSK